jgi:hypothetical protein
VLQALTSFLSYQPLPPCSDNNNSQSVPVPAPTPAPTPTKVISQRQFLVQAPAAMVLSRLSSPPLIFVRVDPLPYPTGALRNASSPLTKTIKYKTTMTMTTSTTPAPFEDCLRPTPTDATTPCPPVLRSTPTPTPAQALPPCGSITTPPIFRTLPLDTTTEGGTPPPKWLRWLQLKRTRWRPTTTTIPHDKILQMNDANRT